MALILPQNYGICCTGHRPHKLGGYSTTVQKGLWKLAYDWLNSLLPDRKPEKVISGMALGWDQAVALAALDLDLPLVAAVPFKGQDSIWPPVSKLAYERILGRAAEVVVVSEGGFSREKMHIRNRWMVDNSHMVLVLWNGMPGGTKNTVDYAKSVGKPLTNLWDNWLQTHGKVSDKAG